jgi:hypothetical protein
MKNDGRKNKLTIRRCRMWLLLIRLECGASLTVLARFPRGNLLGTAKILLPTIADPTPSISLGRSNIQPAQTRHDRLFSAEF